MIDEVEYEYDFSKFRIEDKNVDICYHFAASMFGENSFWLKNEILLSPQRYLDQVTLLTSATVDMHNTGVTSYLKEATDKFFYFKLKLANGETIILHVGRYRDSQKLYLYYASRRLPEYVENPQ